MTSKQIIQMPTEALVDLVWLRQLKKAEEDILVQAELFRRDLTPSQKNIVARYFTAERCRYNYDAVME